MKHAYWTLWQSSRKRPWCLQDCSDQLWAAQPGHWYIAALQETRLPGKGSLKEEVCTTQVWCLTLSVFKSLIDPLTVQQTTWTTPWSRVGDNPCPAAIIRNSKSPEPITRIHNFRVANTRNSANSLPITNHQEFKRPRIKYQEFRVMNVATRGIIYGKRPLIMWICSVDPRSLTSLVDLITKNIKINSTENQECGIK